MAEGLDTRDWQAGVDAGLVRRLQRPLRRSAAASCAWAREALARGRLGKLPLLASWSLRWGMNEAALAGLRPVVHAIGEASERTGEAPRMATVAGRPAVASAAAAMVAVGRRADAPEPGTPPGTAMTAGPRGEAGAPGSSVSRVVTEVVQVSPTASSLDLRVDPALLGGPVASEVAAPPSATRRVNEEPGMPPRPRTRPRLVTPMDLAREQADAVRIAATIAAAAHGTVTAERAAAPTNSEPEPADAPGLPRVAATEPVAPAVAIVDASDERPARGSGAPVEAAAAPSVAPPIVPATQVAALQVAALQVEASAAIVHTHERSAAPGSESRLASPGPAPRVRARVVGTPIASSVLDGPQLAAAARPRVSVPAPTQPGAPELTGLVAAQVGPGSAQAARTDRMDLGLPAAVATSVSPQPAAAPPPAPRPVAAKVETSQLDMPAIAQAVQRHLEREMRWERERRGGRS